ncbi:MAG: hypothetical protein ACK5P6_09050 [Pseudobdellovibrionaceae bacterium]|jgi:hypothetical protein
MGLSEVFLILTLLIMGFYFIAGHPLAEFLGVKRSIDTWIGFSITLSLFVFLAVHQYNTQEKTAKVSEFCSEQSLTLSCYKVTADTCEAAFDNYRTRCIEKIKPEYSHRPSALIGPLVKKCISVAFDKSLKFQRNQSRSPACEDFFAHVDGPRFAN